MAKYIDSGKLLKAVEKELENLEPPHKKSKSNIEYSMGRFETERVFRHCLFLAECEDVAPVVHAHWNEFSDYTGTCYAECSRCGLLWWIEEGTAEENEMFYCPKCGAKMDGKEGKE